MPFTAALGALVLSLVLVPAAWAGPSSPTTAAVSLGDSYISGEAGRWAGNSVTPAGDKDGTDRACLPAGLACQVDKTRVYEAGTENAGCHRSDVAEIKSARLAVAERIDLSCSGGQTKNIFRASQGGVGQNGEPPQADKLLLVARSKNVKLVMLSIGGNDLGFGSIIAACLQAYVARTGPCEPSQQQKIDALKPKVIAAVGKAIDEIRAVMTQDGYSGSDYRLILQTYPSVAPRAAETRYPENGSERTANGCPFYDQDLNWARDRAAPQIGDVVRAGAQSRGIETLELIDAFQGHEFCSKTSAQSTPLARPAPAGAEWGRFLGGSTIQQGELQEAFHPNAYGQQALGACLTKVFMAPPGSFACAGGAGVEPSALAFRQLSTFPAPGPAPVISDLAARQRCVRGAQLITPTGDASGLAFTFRLNALATVRYVIKKRDASPGRSTCPTVAGVAPGRATEVSSQQRDGVAGANTTSLARTASRASRSRLRAVKPGRVRVTLAQIAQLRTLTPGTYILYVAATDASGRTSNTARVKFWVLTGGG